MLKYGPDSRLARDHTVYTSRLDKEKRRMLSAQRNATVTRARVRLGDER
jgi:hypothetical protein